MKSSIVRKEIHDYVDQADERFLSLVYSMIQAEKESHEISDTELQSAMIRRAEASERDIAEGRTIGAKDFKLKLENWIQKKSAGIK